MDIIEQIMADLATSADPEKAAFFPHFFQTYPGSYGEGDRFLGITVPKQRKVANRYYRQITLTALAELLKSEYHEHRLTALFMLVRKYEASKEGGQAQALVDFYLANLDGVNNWDLVDSSAYKILGDHLIGRDRAVLYQLAASGNLWRERIAIIATLALIRVNDFDDTLALADRLLNHEHDLIHKAVGWMLREVGNRDFEREYKFLAARYRRMPRTMLRYAIEKFDPTLRQHFLKGTL